MLKKLKKLIRRNSRLKRNNIFDFCLEFISRNDVKGHFAEFGTFKGLSASRILRALDEHSTLRTKSISLHLFDSFAGLPELKSVDIDGDRADFMHGEYASTMQDVIERIRTFQNVFEVKFYPGYFEESLLERKAQKIEELALIHIDVDLYSSCIPVLEYLTPRLADGALIVFDDYFCYRGNPNFGVRKAFEEWKLRYVQNFDVTHYTNYAWSGAVFIVTKK